jgi:dTDP-glucose 4,6-dehydratase
MNKYNILVTGVNGFVGKALIQKLSNDEYNIYALDIMPPDSFADSKIKRFYQQDLTKPFKLDEAFDFVFHLAAYNVTHVGSANPEEYRKVNVLGTENLLRSANISNLVFLSTAKVYKTEGNLIDEDSALKPMHDYEKSKLESENICRKQFKGENLCIFRSINIVGPGQSRKAIIPVLFNNAILGKPLDIFAPKEFFLQFLYIDDITRLFEIVMAQGGVSGIFNLFSKDKIRIDKLAFEIIQLCQSSSTISFFNQTRAIFSEVISKKLKKTFGWEAQIEIKEILQKYHKARCLNK